MGCGFLVFGFWLLVVVVVDLVIAVVVVVMVVVVVAQSSAGNSPLVLTLFVPFAFLFFPIRGIRLQHDSPEHTGPHEP